MKKRILSIMLVIILLVTCLPLSASAATVPESAITSFVNTASNAIGKTQSGLGLSSGNWCGYFVGYCINNSSVSSSTGSITDYWCANGMRIVRWMTETKNTGKAYMTSSSHYTRLKTADGYSIPSDRLISTSNSSFSPQKGDIVLFTWSDRSEHVFSHMGIVSAVSSSNITYIDGNSSSGGGKVASHTMAKSNNYIIGYVRFDSTSGPAPDPTPIDVIPGVYTIHSARNENYVIDIQYDSKEVRANIQLYEVLNNTVQQFRIEKNGSAYTIQSVYSGYWLDVKSPYGLRSNVQLWNANNRTEEQWSFEDAGNGCVYIRNGYGYYLDIAKDAVVNNANIQVFTKDSVSVKWKLKPVNNYKITYNPNGGKGAPASQSVEGGKTAYVSSAIPTRSGYTFLGWSMSSGATSATYQPGSSISVNSNTTLYAIWKLNIYTLYYNANGGSGAPGAQTISSIENAHVSTKEPVQDGYLFLGWATSSGADSPNYLPGDAISISRDMTLYAVWQEEQHEMIRLSYYYFAGSTKNGYEEKELENASCLFQVRSSEDQHTGYTFKGWSWNKNSTIPEYQPGDVVEIEEDRTLYAVWEPDGSISFSDVTVGTYDYDAVNWAVQNSITAGTGDGSTFSPNKSCTRAEAVTFLWRAAGEPEPEGGVKGFNDVSAGAYYNKAVQWAVVNNITSGTGSGNFSPNMTCDRSQIVSFLYRAANSPSVSGGSSFSDVSADKYYANAVQWAVANNITSGTGAGKFSPTKSCTRGEIVTFLYRNF